MSMSIRFLGAARNVTGSKYLVRCGSSSILVDCGLYQERNLRGRNWEPLPVDPATIDGVVLTHGHLDHCGWLPRLVRDGLAGPVFCTSATADIVAIVLRDSARIQAEDAAYKTRRHRKEGRQSPRPIEPLYTVQEAETALGQIRRADYRETMEVAPGIGVEFHGAGHILGSTLLCVTLTEGSTQRVVVFSGDLGRWDMPILEDPTILHRADYVVTESTYGDRVHEDVADKLQILEDVVTGTAGAGGNVVVPSFSIGRTQDLLYCLNELVIAERIPRLPVFLDSPMAIRVNGVFQDHPELYDSDMKTLLDEEHSPFALPNLQLTASSQQSRSINHIRGTAVIIAGSGMCTGGRIKHHLVHNISRRESTLLFVGYQAVGTLGREIVGGAKRVRIFGTERPIRAKVRQIHGFSAHADRDELQRWMRGFGSTPRRVFVTHGEEESALSYAELLRADHGLDAVAPEYDQEIALE